MFQLGLRNKFVLFSLSFFMDNTIDNRRTTLAYSLLEQIVRLCDGFAQFRDAIESLSPEQQRFAKAYRAMQAFVSCRRCRCVSNRSKMFLFSFFVQLESSMFAVVVVQIKPVMLTLKR